MFYVWLTMIGLGALFVFVLVFCIILNKSAKKSEDQIGKQISALMSVVQNLVDKVDGRLDEPGGKGLVGLVFRVCLLEHNLARLEKIIDGEPENNKPGMEVRLRNELLGVIAEFSSSLLSVEGRVAEECGVTEEVAKFLIENVDNDTEFISVATKAGIIKLADIVILKDKVKGILTTDIQEEKEEIVVEEEK